MVNIESAKVFLTTSDTTDLDVTLMFDNWQDWQVEMDRALFSSTVKETTFSMTFTGDAKTALDTAFSIYGQNAVGSIRILYLEDNVENNYDLDFGTYLSTYTGVEISCRLRDLNTAIKSNGRTEYEIDMASISLNNTLHYPRITLDNNVIMRRSEMESVDGELAPLMAKGRLVGMSYLESETPVQDYVMYEDVLGGDNTLPGQAFTVLKTGTYTLKYISHGETDSVGFRFSGPNQKTQFLNAMDGNGFTIAFSIKRNGTNLTYTYYDMELIDIVASPVTVVYAYSNPIDGSVLTEWTGTLNQGDRIRLEMTAVMFREFEPPSFTPEIAYSFNGVGDFELSYKAKNAENKIYLCTNIANIIPQLLRKMGVDYDFNVSIETSKLDKLLFIPQDIINGRSDPLLTTSFSKIEQLLKLCCCGMRIDGNTLTVLDMIEEGGIYDPFDPSVFFESYECGELEVSPFTDIVFSSFKVNYDSNTSEAKNYGKEFNRTTEYSMDVNSTNSLEVTCPYRTDSLGFELSIPYREGDSNAKNKTIYLVDAEFVNEVYQPIFADINGETSELFNGHLSPAHIARNWQDNILSCSSDTLLFASSEGRTNITVDGQSLGENLSVYDSVFMPVIHAVKYEIKTSDDKKLRNLDYLNGYVSFDYDGKIYTGFVTSISENPLLRDEKEMSLLKFVGNTQGEHINVPYKVLVYDKNVFVGSREQTLDLYFDIVGENVTLSDIYITDISGQGTISDITVVANRVRFKLNVTENTGNTNRVYPLRLLFRGTTYTYLNIVTQYPASSVIVEVYPSSASTLNFIRNGEFNEDNFVLLIRNELVSNISVDLSRAFTLYNDFDAPVVSTFTSYKIDGSSGRVSVNVYGRNYSTENETRSITYNGDNWNFTTTINFIP